MLKVLELDIELNRLISQGSVLEDIVPGLHYVWESGGMRKMKSLKKELIDDYIGKKFQEHKNTFDKGRDGYYDVSTSMIHYEFMTSYTQRFTGSQLNILRFSNFHISFN